MNIPHTIGKGTVWLSVSSLVVKVVGLFTTFIVLKSLSLYQYGLIELVLSIVPLLSFSLLPGLSSVIVADMGVERGKGNISAMKGIFLNFIRLQGTLALVAFFIVFFGAELIARFYPGDLGMLIRIASFLFLVAPLRTLSGILLEVDLRFRAQSLYSLVEEGIKLGCIMLALLVFHASAAGVVFATVLSQALAVALLAPVVTRAYAPLRGIVATRPPFFSLLQAHGKWSVFSGYMRQFTGKARLWIIAMLLNTEAVALFAVAEGLIGHTVSLVPLSRALTPLIPRFVDDRERFLRIVKRAMKYQLVAFVLLAGFAALAFPPILVLIFPAYASSMELFRLMLLSLIPVSVSSILRPVFSAYKEQKSLFVSSTLRTVEMLLLAPLFITLWGLTGAAIEYVITSLFFTLERYRVLSRKLPGLSLSLRDLSTMDEYDRLILSSFMDKLRHPFR